MDSLRPGDPERVGGYRLLGRLGGGGMGQVFLGRSPGGRPVAVKVVRPEYGADAEFRRRFEVEVEAARRVGGFYTAHVVDADPRADRPWLVTAYVAGPSLRAAVAEHGPLPVATVRVLGAGLAEGLAAIHGCGLVHRDLKPGNVILAADGPRVIDFGIARALEAASTTATGVLPGTPAYMSPEQADGDREIGPASDVFSLGSVLVFAAGGSPPFGSGAPVALLYRIQRGEPDLAGVPAELRELVTACLAKDPADRPGVADVLSHLADAEGPGGRWLPPAITAMIAAATDIGPAAAPQVFGSGLSQPTVLDPPRPVSRNAPLLPDPAAPSVQQGPAVPVRPGRGTIRWVIGGVGGLVAVALAAVLALMLPRGGEGAATSPVTGRIDDSQAGLSYARLAAPWSVVGPAWTQPGMFTGGQVAAVQDPANGATFIATSLSGVPRPEERPGYRGPADLAALTTRVKARVLREHFTDQPTPTTLSAARHPLADGKEAWLERVRLDFPRPRPTARR